MKTRIAIAISALVFSAPAFSAPAFWYKWRSKTDGTQFCAQISPGPAWERLATPYKDGRCEKPEVDARRR
jgi:hypothetical protein